MKRFPPLFRNLPKEFFRVLALGNVEESYRLIALIDDYFGPLRYDVGREELASYLAEQMKKDVIDDFEVEAKTPLEKARSFLRRLVEYGWLDKEEGEGFSDRLSRSDAFMKTVPVLLEIAEEEERSNEYFGLTEDIYRSLVNFDYQKSTAALEQISSKCAQLYRHLLSVNSQIKRFVAKALEEEGKTEKEILDTLLVEFQKHPALLALNNLQGPHNPEIRHVEIIKAVEHLKEEEVYAGLIADYLATKHVDDTEDGRKEAASFVSEVLDNVLDLFEGMPSQIKEISMRNTSYVQATRAILEFRLNNFRDIEGALNRSLKLLKKVKKDAEIDTPFAPYNVNIISNESIYKPRFLQKKAPGEVPFVEGEEDPEAIERAERFLREERRYGKTSIIDFLASCMDANSEYASELHQEGLDGFIKLSLAPAYAPEGYSIGEPTGEKFELGDYVLDDYLIEKKGD